MTDIVERLRYMARVEGREVAAEAADEIETLRAAREILADLATDRWHEIERLRRYIQQPERYVQ